MEENVQTNSVLLDAVKKGTILGIIHIVIFLLLYIVAPGKLTGASTLVFTIVINIVYISYYGIQWRREIGGFMNYGTAFKHAFFIFVTNGLVNLVFITIFLLVDSTLPDLLAQAQADTSMYWAQKFGAPDDALEKMRDQMNLEKLKDQYKFLGQLKGFAFLLIFYLIGASLIALFTKKQEPEILQ